MSCRLALSTGEPMRCSKCGVENRERRRFCGGCGSKLGLVCAKCGTTNEPGENFCGDCGAALTASGPRAASASPASDALHLDESRSTSELLDGERKTVTALFADIRGSTELA